MGDEFEDKGLSAIDTAAQLSDEELRRRICEISLTDDGHDYSPEAVALWNEAEARHLEF